MDATNRLQAASVEEGIVQRQHRNAAGGIANGSVTQLPPGPVHGVCSSADGRWRCRKAAALLRPQPAASAKLTAAERTLQDALAALDPSCTRRRSEVLLELALVQLEKEDIDEACRFATQSYAAAVEAGSVLGQRRVGAFRSRLDRWSDAEAVRNLDEQLAGLL